ncbi:DMT family transporter [Vagococcus fluvialis]|uniref:DMT family transporter n=1 Tax=Vagococcus fluvialis TaxID=2738 RepID=UPI003B5AA900
MILFFILLGILAGAFFPIQATINSKLGQAAKNPVIASFVAFSVGSLVLLICLVLFDMSSLFSLDVTTRTYLFFAGPIAGVIFNLSNIVLFSKIGATVTTMMTITGQMVMGIIIDHFGLFNLTVQKVSLSRLLGVLMMFLAIWLFQQAKGIEKTKFSVKWLLLGLIIGILPPLQSAFNGQLKEMTQSILLSVFISFFVGAVILALILLITKRKIVIPKVDLQGKKLPLWVYLGGLFGIFIVGGNIIVIKELGSVVTTIVFILGQLLTAVLIDHLGLFGITRRKIKKSQVFALVLICIALLLV